MRGQGWRTVRQRTAVWRTLRKAQRLGSITLRNRAKAKGVTAMLARIGLK